jgi:DNA-binding NtrC family response regulator
VSFPSEPGKVEISVRQPVGTMQEGAWETGEHVESVEVEEVGRPVVYRSGSTMEDMEREVIAAALEEVKGNRRKAAQMLAIGERTLYRKIKKFGLDEETD